MTTEGRKEWTPELQQWRTGDGFQYTDCEVTIFREEAEGMLHAITKAGLRPGSDLASVIRSYLVLCNLKRAGVPPVPPHQDTVPDEDGIDLNAIDDGPQPIAFM